MDQTRNRLVIESTPGELNDSSRSTLEILKEGQNSRREIELTREFELKTVDVVVWSGLRIGKGRIL